MKVKVGDKTDVQNSGKSVKNLGIKGSQSRPRLFQLHIRPARFCPALLIIQNITNIHFPFWTLGGRCVLGLKYECLAGGLNILKAGGFRAEIFAEWSADRFATLKRFL